MSRRVREESKTGYYHVMQRGAGKQILFEDDTDYQRYVDKLLECVKYIHNNPVKANFGRIDEYAWSSYNEYFGGGAVADTEGIMALFGSQKQFEDFHKVESKIKFDDCDVVASTFDDGLRIIRDYFNNELESSMIVKMLGKKNRDNVIREMKKHGLSNHQIELITGISRDLVRRI